MPEYNIKVKYPNLDYYIFKDKVRANTRKIAISKVLKDLKLKLKDRENDFYIMCSLV